MNLIFRQQGPDHFSVYTENVLIDGELKMQYVSEMYGYETGRYAIELSDSYFSALRKLAIFKTRD